jgi:transposase
VVVAGFTSVHVSRVSPTCMRCGFHRLAAGSRGRRHQLACDEQVIEKARFHAAHFVLVTDRKDRNDKRILQEYRNQSAIEGHNGFRWLKNVALVAPVFLKTPSRIAALGLVFILERMVRNYLQFELRRQLEATNQTVGGRKKNTRTKKPTAETALLHFMGVSGIRVTVGEQILERRADTLTEDAEVVVELLRISPDIFTRSFEKWPSFEMETCRM